MGIDFKEKDGLIYLYCSNCNEPMNATNLTFMSNPPQHIHRCLRCGQKALFEVIFPVEKEKF